MILLLIKLFLLLLLLFTVISTILIINNISIITIISILTQDCTLITYNFIIWIIVFRYTFYFYIVRDYILITCIFICFIVDLSLYLSN